MARVCVCECARVCVCLPPALLGSFLEYSEIEVASVLINDVFQKLNLKVTLASEQVEVKLNNALIFSGKILLNDFLSVVSSSCFIITAHQYTLFKQLREPYHTK